MSTPTLKPLSVRIPLSPTPLSGPRHGVPVTLRDGRQISVADPQVVRGLIALMGMNAVLGGAASHFGGPSALAELNSALYGLVFQQSLDSGRPWFELFHLVNDAGHTENGLYALKATYGFAGLTYDKLKAFRSLDSVLTGHGESHLFPEAVFISNGPLGSSLPQAQGLAMADQLSGSSRVTVTTISDGGCMEGEAREALAAIPGLAKKGKLAPFVLLISDNDTKLSGRITDDSFSMQPTFSSLKDLGWKVVDLPNAHDLQECVKVFEDVLSTIKPNEPVAIHARTVKGKGVQKAERSASGGHGFPLKNASEIRAFVTEIFAGGKLPSELEAWVEELERTVEKEHKTVSLDAGASTKGDLAPAQVKTEKIQTGISNALIKARKAGLPVVSVTSDLPGSTGVADFRKACPEGNFDVGIAESNMVSAAVGLSKAGYIPVVDTFAQFGVTKGALPLLMGSLSEAPVISIFSHTGFQDAADGASHQALSYFAMSGAIPHTQVYALTCSDEAEGLLTQAIDRFVSDRKNGRTPPHFIFFLGRENFPQNYGQNKFKLEKALVFEPSNRQAKKRVAIAAAGSLFPEALKAQTMLEKDGIAAWVVNPVIVNHPDVTTLTQVLEQTGSRLLTVEDHQLTGGFGAQVFHSLIQARVPVTGGSLGVRDQFGRSAYKASDLYRLHGLDAGHIVQAARELA